MRGETAEIGAEREATNGYKYIKTEDRGWVLKHWIIWEAANGRKINSNIEQARFVDGDKTNLTLENIQVIPRGKVRLRTKIAKLEAQKADIEDQIRYYRAQLAKELEQQDSK